jgi:hypothetical protein
VGCLLAKRTHCSTHIDDSPETNMVKPSKAEPPAISPRGGKFDHTVLVLQGGGALGAYQAGLYAGLSEAGVAPDWIAGDSIGAINAALIAGNAPERRVERLSAFWEGVSANTLFMPPPCMEPMRAMLNAFSATSSVTFGVPGFFLHASRLPSKRQRNRQAAGRLTRSGTWQRHEGESAHRRER